jgi:diguanylate cyclase (GGDEF)-like protein
VSALISTSATAGCPRYAESDNQRLDEVVDRNAHEALSEIGAALKRQPTKTPATTRQMAALYAIQAHAYSVLELDAAARESASKGLALATSPVDPLHVNLQIEYGENVYSQADLDHAAETLVSVRNQQITGSPQDLCLLIALGVVEMRRDHAGAAIAALTTAYRATSGVVDREEHVLAAEGLASAMRYAGDFAQALELNREVTDYYRSRGATLQLSVNRFLRGQILSALGNHGAAKEEFHAARLLSVSLDDAQGIAFADQALCRTDIESGSLVTARPLCDSALRSFRGAGATDEVLETEAQLARIDLDQNHAEHALQYLNAVLAHGGAELPARDLAKIYGLRARTNAALYNFRDAYGDLSDYVRRYVAANDAERTRQVAALRAQLETDRALERNQALQQELSSARARTQLQEKQLRWTQLAIAGGAIIIALLTYILMSSFRHRRVLARLASTDLLTGLPNRRRTSELAGEALSVAAMNGSPVTVALLDFDRFKQINDLCGHASGDFALSEFSRLSAQVLRAGDTLGRWGGEEFLLVLPDCPIERAFSIVERLRTLAISIQLPGHPGLVPVTISAGIASNDATLSSVDDIVAIADEALYQAKAAGRNASRIAHSTFLMASTIVRQSLANAVSPDRAA